MPHTPDVVILGGGHNALTAAAYLARSGVATLVLERSTHLGGAAVSAEAFPGTGVRLSRYSYLVSLLPHQVVDDLGLDALGLELRSRSTASYSPVRRHGQDLGLLVERPEGPATAASFSTVTGGEESRVAWRELYGGLGTLARLLAPTLLEPLRREGELRAAASEAGLSDLWRAVVEEPLGAMLGRRFADDLVRGVVGTDALIGTFASLDDPSLAQNRCFLYHLIGNGDGEWRVPVGGMGAVTDALATAARNAGAELRTGCEVTGLEVGAGGCEVRYADGSGVEQTVAASLVLSGVAPYVLDGLLRHSPGDLAPGPKPEGSQLKVNLLLDRLPRLRSGADPAVAFAGTFHVAESATELETAYREAGGGSIPSRPPCELYCHSLTDDSILGPRAGTGAQTLTCFGLHMPAGLFEGTTAERDAAREEALVRTLTVIDEVLAEPILDCVHRDAEGRYCIEANVPQDLEDALHMPGGHIFHGDLSWPWATDDAVLSTPAQRWGVSVGAGARDRVLVCGSGAVRGGAVSGLGGLHASRAALEML